MSDDVGDHGLNNLDTRINDRGFFERILKERKDFDDERDKRYDERYDDLVLRLHERFMAQEKAIDKAEQRLDSTLHGFPQEYARRLELEQMIESLNATSTVLAQKVVDSAAALAEAQDKADVRTDVRIKKVEDFQAKLIGLALGAPILTAVIVFLLTRSGVG